MNLSVRARGLIVEIANARCLPLMSRVGAAERLTAEAASLILELAATVEKHEARFNALLDGIKKINSYMAKNVGAPPDA